MAQFDTPQVTRAGAALMAKVLAGSGKIEFTSLTIGDAEYTDEQKTDAALQERTALKNQRMSFPFSSVTIKDETNVCLKAVVSNEKVTESFYITEMGLWARDASDETSTPVLYSIITASVGDYLPVYNGSVPSTIEEIWYTTVSNKATITISANATAYALAEDLTKITARVEKLEESVGVLQNSNLASEEGAFGVRYWNKKWQIKNADGTFKDASGGDNEQLSQDITALMVAVTLLKGSAINGTSGNVAVETFDDANSYVMVSGQYDKANKRLYA